MQALGDGPSWGACDRVHTVGQRTGSCLGLPDQCATWGWGWGERKQQTFFSHSSGGCKFEIRARAWSSSWWAPFFWLADGPLLIPCVFTGWRQRGSKLFGFSSYKGLNPTLRTSSTSHVPKAPSPRVTPLGARFQQMNSERADTDVPSKHHE